MAPSLASARREGGRIFSFQFGTILAEKSLRRGKRASRIIVKVGIWHYKYKKTTGADPRRLRSLSFHLWQPGKPGLLRHFE